MNIPDRFNPRLWLRDWLNRYTDTELAAQKDWEDFMKIWMRQHEYLDRQSAAQAPQTPPPTARTPPVPSRADGQTQSFPLGHRASSAPTTGV